MYINNLLEKLKDKLTDIFGEKLLFFGLQGSYARGEATANSDIDLVVILDKLTFEDLKTYKNILDEFPEKEKFCGFISGKKEIQNWSKQDIFQFFYDTKPILGILSSVIDPPSIDDIKLSVKISAENLYHSAIHSYLHSKAPQENLVSLYKTSFFILQAKYFIENNKYIPAKKAFLQHLDNPDKEILLNSMKSPENIQKSDLDSLYSQIITWCAQILQDFANPVPQYD